MESSFCAISFPKKIFFLKKKFFSAVGVLPVRTRATHRRISNNYIISLSFYWSFRIWSAPEMKISARSRPKRTSFQHATPKNGKSASKFLKAQLFHLVVSIFSYDAAFRRLFAPFPLLLQKIREVFWLFLVWRKLFPQTERPPLQH